MYGLFPKSKVMDCMYVCVCVYIYIFVCVCVCVCVTKEKESTILMSSCVIPS